MTNVTSSSVTFNSSNGILYTTGTIYNSKSIYNILGKDVKVDGYKDTNLALILSLINTLGLDFYMEIKKNDISLPPDIKEILEEEIVKYNRDKSIEKIVKEE